MYKFQKNNNKTTIKMFTCKKICSEANEKVLSQI